ncbi:polysaccharide lyase 8 family protein [Streptomyces sp. AV19]|uniref:polysaccharide lyase 8 family protein n=1 Tax=Streptomyces sp. AV19 TaxID=2793068 RepID=UPI0018FE281C|nr:polysaccharide lyase 8 family protein [Streptomyces sp. AV19]MBH1933932.1 polysaccharide lyase 8 family protein [Streptomyces sp. AV19]MDG4535584.1 polysaccharide lyase 8 family protein [Streptomyces sp. AV19]
MPPARTRRAFLAAATAALPLLGAQRAAAADEFTALRLRWRGLLLGTGFDPGAEPYAGVLRRTGADARAHRARMNPGPASLWPDAPFDPPAGITLSCARLHTMAQAYVQPGTGLTGDPGLLAATLAGLDHVHATAYHAGAARYGNWWEWQIGTPRLLLDSLALLHDEAGPARRAGWLAAVGHFVPDDALGPYTGTSTGANRVDLCRVVALRGVLGASADRVALARDALSPVFRLVGHGDGLYADGSFLQHTRVAYTGTYGQVLLDGLGRLFALLRGSSWDVTDPGRRTIHDSVERAFAPLVHDGLVLDSVCGRAVSRGLTADGGVPQGARQRGHALIAAIALLAAGAEPAERARWHGAIKGWAARDPEPLRTDPQFGTADLARLAAVLDGPAPPVPPAIGHRLFPAMDRAVHRRPGWTASLAMASDRVAHYENGNGEHPRGWHTGSGMLTWWGPGGDDPYGDGFWPTADPYRMPGTTVSTKRLADNEGGPWGAPGPAARDVGGVTDGTYAAVGQHLKGLSSTLEAHKSWFFADDAVVCLGAGITARDGVPVETVVDHRPLGADGDARLTVDGAVRHERSANLRGVRWAHLEGHGGWVFPGGAEVAVLRESRTGAWRDINAAGSPQPLTRHYLTLRHPHGTDPASGSYAYVLMPGAGRAAVAARAADGAWLTVLANSAACQAVRLGPPGLTAALFHRAGTVGSLTVSAPASVLVRQRDRRAVLHLAEPLRTGAPVELTWDRPVRRVVAHDASVRVRGTGARLRLTVAPGTACAPHRCEVELGRPAVKF